MAAIKSSHRAPASRSRRNFPGNRPGNDALARIVSRPPASRESTRHYSPKEFAAALFSRGRIELHERTVQRRCALPPADPLHIATNAHFPGRDWIPESELLRLLGVSEAVA